MIFKKTRILSFFLGIIASGASCTVFSTDLTSCPKNVDVSSWYKQILETEVTELQTEIFTMIDTKPSQWKKANSLHSQEGCNKSFWPRTKRNSNSLQKSRTASNHPRKYGHFFIGVKSFLF